MMEENRQNLEEESREVPFMYRLADSLIECLYVNYAELANTGDSF